MNAAYIPVILAGISISVGVFFLICEMLGVYRFRYALARMHAAALGDTGGLFFVLLGLIILNGLQASSVKLAAIVLIMWITSPVSGHLLSKLIYYTDSNVSNDCDIRKER